MTGVCKMAKSRVKAATRRDFFRGLEAEALELRYDVRRRFRNALLSLALSDPRWMMWVERTLPPRMDEIAEHADTWLALVEATARWRVLRSYSFFHRERVCGMIYRLDQPFTDRGSLSPG